MMTRVRWGALLLLLLPGLVLARPVTNVSSHLSAVRRQIAKVEAHQRLTEAERQQQELAREQAERDIGRLVEQMRGLDAQVAGVNRQLLALQQRQQQLEQEDQTQTQALMREDRLVWQNVRHDYFRLLLNQQHPEKLARVLHDFRILNADRDHRLQALRRNVAELAQSRQQTEHERDRLAQLQQGLQQRHQELSSAQKRRQRALAMLRRREESDGQKLERLQHSERRLSDLLARLSRPTPGPHPTAPGGALMPAPAGACALPASGGLRNQFAAERMGGLRWNGVVIAVPSGTPVHAVAAGHVVYAAYVRGYGLLIIVDHGQGLLSIYGQNRSLRKRAGDTIQAGEVIAEAGDTGDASSQGVYFEVRRHGHPEDPARWCHEK